MRREDDARRSHRRRSGSHLLKLPGDLLDVIWLSEEDAALGRAAVSGWHAGDDDDLDRRPRTAAASGRPSIPRGISMSVTTMRIPIVVSSRTIASAALATSIAPKPASSARSTAIIRMEWLVFETSTRCPMQFFGCPDFDVETLASGTLPR